MNEPTDVEILAAAMRGDSARLHELVDKLGMSSRHTLFAAGARMLNALAAADAHAARLAEYARDLSPAAQAILAGDHAALGRLPEGHRDGATRTLVRDGLIRPSGELTDAGMTVVQLRATQVRLLAQVQDRALSDEDLDHEGEPPRRFTGTVPNGQPGACPDGGTCWHSCPVGDVLLAPVAQGRPCWRVLGAGPFTGAYPGNDWPQELRDIHRRGSHE